MVEPLGAQLHAAGLVTEAEAEAAARAGTSPTRVARRLIAAGLQGAALAGYYVVRGFGPAVRRPRLDALSAEAGPCIRPEMARALEVLPLRREGDELWVAMLAPDDLHARDEIERAASVRVRASVALADELTAAIEARYPLTNARSASGAVFRDGGGGLEDGGEPVLELVTKRSAADAPNRVEDAVLPLVVKKSQPRTVPVQRTFERPREEAGRRRHAQTVEYTLPSADPEGDPPGSQLAASPPIEGDHAPQGGLAPPVAEAVAPVAPAPAPRPARPRRPADSPTANSEPAGEPLPASSTASSRASASGRPTPSDPPRHPHAAADSPLDSWGPLSESYPPAAPVEDTRPLPDLRPVMAALKEAPDRDTAIHVATEAAAAASRAAVLLALRRGVLKGWEGAGPGVSPEAVRNLWIPIKSPGTLRDVVERGESYVGPHGDSAADQLFRVAIAGQDGVLVVQPVRLAGRVVALICADGVRGGEAGAEHIGAIAQATADALARLVRASKRR